ncbi:unnamed protein product, partial [Brassica rapa]
SQTCDKVTSRRSKLRTRPRSDLYVEDMEQIASHHPKSVLRSKTEEGSKQHEAKETIDEEKEHAEL